jgi:phage head maturation protease
MQFDHGQHPLLGSLPLGRWTVAEEDERGLHLVGRLTDNWLVTPFRDAIRDGGVEGMSFRFAVVQDHWTDRDGKKLRDDEVAHFLHRGPGDRGPILRTLREVKISEAGPVVWPAYEDTAVGVRSRGTVVIDLARLREPAQRRQLAEVVALVESATRDADQQNNAALTSLIDAGYTPDSALAFVNRGSLDELTHTGKISVQLQRDTETPDEPPTGRPSDAPPAPSEPDPQSTAPSPDDHSTRTGDPEVTDHAPGEHSATARPANPTERRDLIREEYRRRLKHVLALTQSSTDKKESA